MYKNMKKLMKVFMNTAFLAIAMAASSGILTNCKNFNDDDDGIDPALITPSVPFNTHFYNPLKTNKNLGDPWLMLHTDGMYYYCGGAINIFSTPTISGLMGYDAIAVRKKNVLADIMPPDMKEIWAPEVHHYKGRWYVFFTATNGPYGSRERRENRRSYVLRSLSDDAFGLWEYMGQLDLPEGQWAIDPTLFEYKGRLFTIWSGWKDPITDGVGKQRLYITELDPENPAKVKAGAKRVEISNPTLSWETVGGQINEGPAVVRSPAGSLFCIYSASSSTNNAYKLGYLKLTGDDPMLASNWQKNLNPLFESNLSGDVFSTGHCSITTSKDGTEYWVIHHAAKASGSGWDRNARAQRLYWGEDFDTPTMDPPNPLSQMVLNPRGEKAERALYEAEDMILNNANIINIPAANARHGRTPQAVRIADLNSSITMNVFIDKPGIYAVMLRHNHAYTSQQFFRVYVNGENDFSAFRASRSGASFTMDAIAVTLLRGFNTLKFTSNVTIDVDCVILEWLNHP